ncbi:MAG: glutamate--tRNA ligase [bacterium]
MTIRVRFPPSPTGHLHVGGARTALFNWLFVRKHGGVFVLRIEDTDRDRSNPEHVAAILESLEWLGLDWDEGPYFQSEGVDRHRKEVKRLLEQGLAYRDFSSAEELASERAQSKRDGSDRRAVRRRAELTSIEESTEKALDGQPHAIRFRVPEGQTIWKDMVHGEMKFENSDIEDLVILRSDGSPTYNFAVASDDASQKITHVIRGDDHLSNTAKQILIYNAMGWVQPIFAHVPMILGSDGKRLSKRHGAASIQAYREDGILKGAMMNFLALLGWNPGDDMEFMDIDVLVERFSIDRVLKKSSIFDLKKLEWLSGQHFNTVPAEELAVLLSPRLEAAGLTTQDDLNSRNNWYLELIDLLKTRARKIVDLVDLSEPFFKEQLEFDESAVRKHWLKDLDRSFAILKDLRSDLAKSDWNAEKLESSIRSYATVKKLKLGEVIHPLRVAVTGRETSPGIFEVLRFLGKVCVLDRLDNALNHLQEMLTDDKL